jgi:hypothetical protein
LRHRGISRRTENVVVNGQEDYGVPRVEAICVLALSGMTTEIVLMVVVLPERDKGGQGLT